MGRDSGYIALHSGIGTGAEHILIPERKTDVEAIIASLQEKEKRKKLVNIVVVAEGDDFGGGTDLANLIKERIPSFDIRVAILGHIQRGGSPSSMDRLIASRMGYSAVECLIEGKTNLMVGIMNNKMHFTPLDKAVKAKQKISDEWLKIVKILAS
jgi:6-phosphofructokinase 1